MDESEDEAVIFGLQKQANKAVARDEAGALPSEHATGTAQRTQAAPGKAENSRRGTQGRKSRQDKVQPKPAKSAKGQATAVANAVPAVPLDLGKLTIQQLLDISEQKCFPSITPGHSAPEEKLTPEQLKDIEHYSAMINNLRHAATQVLEALDESQGEAKQSDQLDSGYTTAERDAAVAEAVHSREVELEAEFQASLLEESAQAASTAGAHQPIPAVFAKAVSTGDAERDQVIQEIAYWLAPDWQLASKAYAIEDAIFRVWGEGAVCPQYRERIHELQRQLCPEGIPGASGTARKRKADSMLPESKPLKEMESGAAAASQGSQHKLVRHILGTTEEACRAAGHVRGKIWAGSIKAIAVSTDL